MFSSDTREGKAQLKEFDELGTAVSSRSQNYTFDYKPKYQICPSCKGSRDVETAHGRGCAGICAQEAHTAMGYGLCGNNGSFEGLCVDSYMPTPRENTELRTGKKNRNTSCLLVRSPTANERCNEQRDSHRLGISLLMLSHQGPLQGSYLDQSLIKTSVHVSTDMQLLEKQSFLRTAFYSL